MKVGIVIVNYQGNSDTQECLDSLEKLQTKHKVTVIVVDNGSREGLKLEVEGYKFDIEVIKNKENLGFAGGNNVGIKKALELDCNYVCILNNDTFVDPGFLDGLIDVYEKNKAGLVSPKIYFAKGHEFHKQRYNKKDLGKVIWYAGGQMDWDHVIGRHIGVDEVDQGQFESERVVDFATGCCMLISADVIKKVGMFNTAYFLYYEDADLSEKIKGAGYKIWYSPKSILWHKNAGSTGGSGSALQDYYITRNRMLFAIQYASFRVKMHIIAESLRILINGRPWQKKAVQDFYMMKFGKGTYGQE